MRLANAVPGVILLTVLGVPAADSQESRDLETVLQKMARVGRIYRDSALSFTVDEKIDVRTNNYTTGRAERFAPPIRRDPLPVKGRVEGPSPHRLSAELEALHQDTSGAPCDTEIQKLRILRRAC